MLTHNLSRGPCHKYHLLVQALHGQQSLLRLLGSLLGAPRTVEGFAKGLVEAGLTAQEVGHQEVKQAPQLQHVVLDGRASQDEAVLGHHLLAGLRKQKTVVTMCPEQQSCIF